MVTDAFSRKIVGTHVHRSLHTAGYLAALAQAVRQAGAAAAGCIHHSDRGSQYVSEAYQTALTNARFRCSMADGYDCYQNALAERVNGILKDEFLFVLPDDLTQARQLVQQAVHLYNHERPHLALNFQTPTQIHQHPPPPENPNGGRILFLSTFSRTRQFLITLEPATQGLYVPLLQALRLDRLICWDAASLLQFQQVKVLVATILPDEVEVGD